MRLIPHAPEITKLLQEVYHLMMCRLRPFKPSQSVIKKTTLQRYLTLFSLGSCHMSVSKLKKMGVEPRSWNFLVVLEHGNDKSHAEINLSYHVDIFTITVLRSNKAT